MQGEKIRTIHFGIGAVGSEVIRLLLERPDVEIVGAIDSHPAKAGKDLGDAAGIGRTVGITVSHDPEPVLKDVYADVVVHATGSHLTTVCPELLQIVAAEKNVISSCEELSYPWRHHPDIARTLDKRARETGVRILGTGVNPGFVMDTLPLVLTTACQHIKSIQVTRVVDVSTRRMQLQRKVGVGLSVQGFQQEANGSIGHVGLRESVSVMADTLGWRLDDIAETIEPVIAQERKKTEYFVVERGYVAGVRQTARGLMSGREVIRLELEMSLDAKDPRDVIVIDGKPPLKVAIAGGVQGDQATAAILANCVPAVANARSLIGLITMRDLPFVPYFRTKRQLREELVE